MAAGEDWTDQEVEAVVRDYFAMLRFELAGQNYNKTEHRRSLLHLLDGRSDGAVELKHQNISAVLRDVGHFWISGYKPRGNYQYRLATEVVNWIGLHPELDKLAIAAAEAPAVVPQVIDYSQLEVEAPKTERKGQLRAEEAPGFYGKKAAIPQKHDYVAREARNIALGTAGEELVVKYERYRLSRLGHDRLAEKVEHVTATQGDGLGFDVLSFGEDGREKFIEVKTTAFGRETPFFASAGELNFARRNPDHFSLYRLFEFKKRPRLFALKGAVESHCALDPVSFRCSV